MNTIKEILENLFCSNKPFNLQIICFGLTHQRRWGHRKISFLILSEF